MWIADKRIEEARRLAEKHQFTEAAVLFEKLSRLYPNQAQIWFEYSCAAANAHQLEACDQAWQRVQQLEPNNYQMQLQIGHQFQNLRLEERARGAFEKAAEMDPGAIDPRMALAILFERNHRIGEARQAVESCLKLNKGDDQARYFLALLDRRENKLAEAEQTLRDLIASGPKHQFVQYAAHYELAEVLNRTDHFDEAMQNLLEAKRIVRGLVNVQTMWADYDQTTEKIRRHTMTLPKTILRIWAKEFSERARSPIPRLAFLGGHPRSGTTLLEQILGAHPDVAALDEPQAFDMIAGPMFMNSPQLPPARINVIRKRYIEAMVAEVGNYREGQLLLDKNPSPTTRLRIWLRIFPELRVVIALRDPRDVLISCFFQNLPLNVINSNFLTLERTAQHYRNMMDLWLAVREWEGFSWIETRYEDTVKDLSTEGRRITEFLGLSWHEDQSKFYDSSKQRRVYAPTYHDASQPIYKRSVSRWTAYEKYLEPVRPILEPFCRAFGYSSAAGRNFQETSTTLET